MTELTEKANEILDLILNNLKKLGIEYDFNLGKILFVSLCLLLKKQRRDGSINQTDTNTLLAAIGFASLRNSGYDIKIKESDPTSKDKGIKLQ